MRRLLLAAVLLAAQPAAALAHATLESASPPQGSTVKGSPTNLDLHFSEPVEARFSRVEVLNAAGKACVAASWYTDGKDDRRLIVPVITLVPGAYTVRWRVASVDTHKSSGTYRFTVAP